MRYLVLLSVLVLAGCDSNPIGPTPPPPTPSGPQAWTVSGRIVSNPGNQSIAGATVRVDGLGTFTADGGGNFTIKGEGFAQDYKATISASGFQERETYIKGGSNRDNIKIDLLGPPFSLDFFQQIARDLLDLGQLRSLSRYMENPRFYIKTTDQNGNDLPQKEIDMIVHVIKNNMPILTRGQYDGNFMEFGRDSRPEVVGWTKVEVTTDPIQIMGQGQYCGTGSRKAILLKMGGCSCNSEFQVSPYVVAHELGHAAGLYHHGASTGIMRGTRSCGSGNSDSRDIVYNGDEKLHSEILYSRLPGNSDPDRDAKASVFSTSGGDGSRNSACIRLVR